MHYKIEKSAQQGRYVVANQPIPEVGTEILRVPLLAMGLCESYRKRICAHCVQWNTEGPYHLHCIKCKSIYYCSNKCRKQVESELGGNHGLICRAMRALSSIKQLDRQAKSILSLLLNVIARWEGSRRRKSVERWIRGEILEMAGGLHQFPNDNDDDNYDYDDAVKRKDCSESSLMIPLTEFLQSHSDQWRSDQRKDWKRGLRFLDQFVLGDGLSVESLFRYPTDAAGERSNDGSVLEERWLEVISAVESNAFGIFTPNQRRPELAGRAVYPQASLFNHSCESNCEAQRQGRHLSIVTRIPIIESGEELSLSYIETNLPLSARRYELQSNYFFHCKCPRCLREETVGTGTRNNGRGKKKISSCK